MRLLLCCVLLSACVEATRNHEEMKLQPLKFKAPELTEEETESNYIPDELKCDACHAVVFQISKSFKRAEEHKRARTLSESDVLDVLWPLCENGFEEYGLKEVDGVHRLTGPGLETAHSAGLAQMGGKWPRRIRDICSVLIGDVGEMEIYEFLRLEPYDVALHDLCKKRCPKRPAKQQKLKSKVLSPKTEL